MPSLVRRPIKLGDHCQHFEQQPADRVGRVMRRRADAELDLDG
jgi:hypothetical protein